MDYGLAILFALFVWWFSTGAALYVVGLPERWRGPSLAVASGVAVLAVWGLWASSGEVTATSAYCAFTCGLLVWAWHELAFLTGLVTGPRQGPCPEHATGWRRFTLATEALLYHELAILGTAAGLAWLLWDQPNQVGVWTFVGLWLMRISAKLNVFFGVPNLTEEFLPPRVTYLKTYFRRRPINLFFAPSVTAATVATALLIMAAAAPDASAFEAAGFSLVATLMALAVLEHWLLVLPLPAAALWSWGLKSRELAEDAAPVPFPVRAPSAIGPASPRPFSIVSESL